VTTVPNMALTEISGMEEFWRSLTSTYSPKTLLISGSLLVQAAAYVSCSLPSAIFDFIPALTKYRYQPSKKPTWDAYMKCLKLAAFTHCCFIYPAALSLHFVFGLDSMPISWESMPRWYITLAKLIASLYIEDTWHYFLHRLLHSPMLYKSIHKQHHVFLSPFGLTAESAHPLENMIVGAGFLIPVLLFCDHLSFFWLWMALRTGQACDAHSGYNLWNPLWLLPFYGGSFYHDFHHSHMVGNYASSFTHWDAIFGTDKDFKKYLAEKELKGTGFEKFKDYSTKPSIFNRSEKSKRHDD
jgi:methylsterol monooxygenase